MRNRRMARKTKNAKEICIKDDAHFVESLKDCIRMKDIHRGWRLYEDALERGLLKKNLHIGNTMISMLAKHGFLEKARQVLDGLPVRDIVSWNALISGYVQHGWGYEALNCFQQMQNEGVSFSAVTFACILRACANLGQIEKGTKIHDEIISRNLLEKDAVLGTALVDMYVKCRFLTKATAVFHQLPCRDVGSWNALIAGYAQQGNGNDALKCFQQMQNEGISPDLVTFTCILKSCGTMGAIRKCEKIHHEIASRGFLHTKNIVLGTALVDMYAKCGMLTKAQNILHELPFRNVITWNALIAEYVQRGQGDEAMNCFQEMQEEGVSPDAVTLACILKVCGSSGAIDRGERIHHESIKMGLLDKNIILTSALVDMYAKCGALGKAQEVFDEYPFRNVVSWTALIAAYAQQERGEDALKCFQQMQSEGIWADMVTFACTLKACGSTGAIKKGKQIHNEIVNRGLLYKNPVLGTALIDMYAKCGDLSKAQQVLDAHLIQDVAPWNALITGFCQQGHGDKALRCFECMRNKGIPPDAITLVSVLNACSLCGKLEEAEKHFSNMSSKYGISPNMQHYTCMVNAFGRVGYIDNAVLMILKLSSPDYLPLWHALLTACRKWGNVKLGKVAFDSALKLNNEDAAAYALMADIYAAANMKEAAKEIEAMRLKKCCLSGNGSWAVKKLEFF